MNDNDPIDIDKAGEAMAAHAAGADRVCPHSWEIPDRNCLSYWFPRLLDAGIPVPRTGIVGYKGGTWDLANLCDGRPVPEEFAPLCAAIEAWCARLGTGYPYFLRTGQGSGKHDWKNCCYLPDAASIPSRVSALVNWSHMVDMMGLYHDVWVVREMLPVEPIGVLPRYGDMPLVREIRGFAAGGKIQCWHQYWPDGAIRSGWPVGTESDIDLMIRQSIINDATFDGEVRPLLERVAAAFAGDGAWSVDVLQTKRGYFVTDMAEAHRSYHWPECANSPRRR